MTQSDSPEYVIRNYLPADLEDLVQFYQEAERLEPVGKPVSRQDIMERMSHPNYNPRLDLFLVTADGVITGCGDMLPELGINRVILSCWLMTEHRRRGLARKLLASTMQRARELGAGLAHANINENNVTAKEVLTRLGFYNVRHYLDFEIDTGHAGGQSETAAGEIRHLKHGEEYILTQLENASFAGSWGYNPNTPETTTYYLNRSRRSHDDVILSFDGGTVTGFCWTEATGHEEGRISMLGVAPDRRGKGTGKRLLLAGLAYLKSRGLPKAVLTVDSANTVACSLYRSVGFRPRSGSLWYEKAVD